MNLGYNLNFMLGVKLNKSKLYTAILLLSTNLFALDDFNPINGEWWVSHYDKKKNISFLNLSGEQIQLNFIGQKRVTSNNGDLKDLGVEFKDNTLIFGNLFRDEIRHNKFVYEVFPKKEYINNLLCYQIKPVKISARHKVLDFPLFHLFENNLNLWLYYTHLLWVL